MWKKWRHLGTLCPERFEATSGIGQFLLNSLNLLETIVKEGFQLLVKDIPSAY